MTFCDVTPWKFRKENEATFLHHHANSTLLIKSFHANTTNSSGSVYIFKKLMTAIDSTMLRLSFCMNGADVLPRPHSDTD